MNNGKKTGSGDACYDERQSIERGNAFRNGYLSLLAAIAACYFLRDAIGWKPVDDGAAMLLCFWISVVTVSATMIVKNAYDGIADGQKAVIVWIMGAAGTVGFTDVVVRGIRGTFDWYGNAGTVFTAAGLLVIFAVYRVKRRHDERLERAREQT